VHFRILGPLEFFDGRDWAPIGAKKWRSLLAVLLVRAGEVVPSDRLIAEVWGDDPPAGANNLVSVYALRLRRLIGDEQGQVLRTRAPGYQLALEPGDLDAARFGELVTEARQELARHDPQRAAELLTGALSLWRGEALLDVPPSPLLIAEAERLAEARLDAVELRIEAEIGCGRPAEVIGEVSKLVTDHPLREGLWGLLMRALDGAGRHAEALATYSRAKDVLVEELGVDPGEPLQRLFQELLTRQPSQLPAGEGTAAYREPPEPDPPRQLPADIADFTGRARDLARLCELTPGDETADSAGAVQVALVTGAGGLGKTTLAVHAAHRLRPRFPHGQLYADLLGGTAQPLAAADVLARFLRDLGVSDAQIPDGEEARAGLYRTRLADRQVLVLLDNARDYAQVRPLLPGSSSCAVLVTTRKIMPELVTARLVDLDVLEEAEARALFAGIVGAPRVDAEPEASGEVLAACAGLPLAIRIAGARLAARRSWTVRALAGRLRSQQRRLDELTAGALAVRASFEVSYASLPGLTAAPGIDPARAFRLLGLWAGPVISLAAAAALFGLPTEAAQDALEHLVDAHLLESPTFDVYRFHDLLRVYAAERSQAEPGPVRQDAVRRILSWYLHTTEAAAWVVSPNHTPVPVSPAEPELHPLAFVTRAAAMDWYEAERANLTAATRLAADSGLHDLAWQLPAAAMVFFYRRSHWVDWITTHETGLASAQRLGDRLGEAWMLNNLGMAHGHQHQPEAIGYLEQALAIYQEVGSQPGQARAANNLATAWTHLKDYGKALEAGQHSLEIQRAAGNRYGEGIALGNLGSSYRELGRYREAIDCYQHALGIFRELGNDMAEADSLSELGDVYLQMGQTSEALGSLEKALVIWSSTGNRYYEAMTLKLLGLAQERSGRPDEARGHLATAERIFTELGDQQQVREIHSQLEKLPPQSA